MNLIIAVIGSWLIQDGLASIAFYGDKEKWLWNHVARLIRVAMGAALIIIGAMK